MNISSLLGERAALSGGSPAIIDYSTGHHRVFTFADLEARAANTAAQFQAAGLRPGDAVLVLQPMSAELYIVLSALFRLGLVAMFVDPSEGLKQISACCAMKSPKAFVGNPRAHLFGLLSSSLRCVPLKFSTGAPLPGVPTLATSGDRSLTSEMQDFSPDSPALLRFTSGSTGQPKAALRTHSFLLEQQRVIQRSLGLQSGEVDFTTMPMFILANLASGVVSLIPSGDLRAPGSISPTSLWRQIQLHRPTRMGASPALLERLADYATHRSQRLDCFQRIFTGGAPVFPALLDKARRMAPGADIAAVYGSTEVEPIALLHQEDVSQLDREAMRSGRGVLAGFPDEMIRLKIINETAKSIGPVLTEPEFEAICRPSCQPGQIVVSGAHVQPGYLHGIGDAETKLLVNGTIWHRTGDSGYLDGDGRLWLLGRSSARIQDRRGLLYPFQAECAACDHPGVRRAALLEYDAKRILLVETYGSLQIAELEDRLAWAQLDQIKLIRRLPVDGRHNAKIDYMALRKLL